MYVIERRPIEEEEDEEEEVMLTLSFSLSLSLEWKLPVGGRGGRGDCIPVTTLYRSHSGARHTNHTQLVL